MAKKKRKPQKLGALGPASHWLDLSPTERAKTKQYIKDGLLGWARDDGIKIPGARNIYSGMSAGDGFDLRHIERWPKARLDKARRFIQSINTLTSRPFSVIVPRTRQQKLEAHKFTGQNLRNQKEFIAQVQIQERDKAVFRGGKVGIERKFPSGSKTIKQRYLFADYLKPDETIAATLSAKERQEYLAAGILQSPRTFREMRKVVARMLLDMPKNVYGQPAFYALITPQYGPIGRMAVHGKVMSVIDDYFSRYDPGGTVHDPSRHQDFAETIVGFQMIGNKTQMDQFQLEKQRLKRVRKAANKLRFTRKKKNTLCTALSAKTGRRCERELGHGGKHRFPI